MQRVDIPLEDIKQWNKDEIVLITAGTGRGKTTWVLKNLLPYCYERDLHILFLSNRNSLKEQTEYQIDDDSYVPEKYRNNIKVENYQELAYQVLYGARLPSYDFIICDEAHWFFTDCSFYNKTDVSFKYIMKQPAIKIFMTATPQILLFYFHKIDKIPYRTYELNIDYNDLIHKFYLYYNDKCLKQYILDQINNCKILYFSSAENAYRTSVLIKDSAFYCSKNSRNYQYACEEKNKTEYQNIINNSKFDCKLFATTSVFDNGVNFDDEELKIVICDYFDLEEIIQQIGRKRLKDDEKINIVIKNHTNSEIKSKLNRIKERLNQAIYLTKYGSNAYSKKYFKTEHDIMIDDITVKDDYSPTGEHIEYRVNKMVYTQVLYHKYVLEKMLRFKDDGFRKYLKKQLKYKGDTPFLECKYDQPLINSYLSSIVGKKLFCNDDVELDEQERLKQFLAENDSLFNPCKRNHDSLGMKAINSYFEENNIPYIIKNNQEKSTLSENYNKSYWIVGEINYQ